MAKAAAKPDGVTLVAPEGVDAVGIPLPDGTVFQVTVSKDRKVVVPADVAGPLVAEGFTAVSEAE